MHSGSMHKQMMRSYCCQKAEAAGVVGKLSLSIIDGEKCGSKVRGANGLAEDVNTGRYGMCSKWCKAGRRASGLPVAACLFLHSWFISKFPSNEKQTRKKGNIITINVRMDDIHKLGV